jgi:hypothetical protein
MRAASACQCTICILTLVILFFLLPAHCDAKLRAAVLASPELATSKRGNPITNVSLLVESLADKAWSKMSAEEKAPWKSAAQASKQTVEGVDWHALSIKARKCTTLIRFIASMHALVGTSTKSSGRGCDDVPALLRRYL